MAHVSCSCRLGWLGQCTLSSLHSQEELRVLLCHPYNQSHRQIPGYCVYTDFPSTPCTVHSQQHTLSL